MMGVEGNLEPILEDPQEELREAWVDNRQKNSHQLLDLSAMDSLAS